MTDIDQQWLQRADAIGRIQARYMWIGAVVGLFYFTLFYSAPTSQAIKVPFVELVLNADAVLASGGSVIAFLLIATVGSLRAWGDAMKAALGPKWESIVEKYDMHPTAFDLAHHTTKPFPRFELFAKFLFYPTFLALLLAESAWLTLWVWISSPPGRVLFLVTGIALWLWAAWFVGAFWWSRLSKARTKRRAG